MCTPTVEELFGFVFSLLAKRCFGVHEPEHKQPNITALDSVQRVMCVASKCRLCVYRGYNYVNGTISVHMA